MSPSIALERSFPCARCGGKLVWAPGVQAMRCPYCGAENEAPAPEAAVEEIDLEGTLARLEAEAIRETHGTVKCGACAAEVELPANVVSLPCPFCGANLIATRHAHTQIKPNCLLPFVVPQRTAAATFRDWLGSRWFAPNALKREGRLDAGIKGTYIPAWTFDARAATDYTGQRGDAYYVTVGSGKNRTRQRRIRWRAAAGRVHNRFDDVLVLATRSLPARQAERLEPWDLAACVPYEDAYLAGFIAEAYQVDLREGFALGRALMEEEIRRTVRRDIGGDEQRIDSMQVHWQDLTFKHVLLPVWISAYRYRGQVYRFLVNARTGEVQGERPYSAVKIALASLAGLLLAALLAYLFFLARR